MNEKTNTELLQKAYEAAGLSYSPYSGFRVGACLLCADGSIITGCNIENSAYSATMCAERTAIFEAIKKGRTKFAALAVVSPDSGKPCFPCGECLQVICEFCGPGFEIVVDSGGIPSVFKLEELLPHAFKMR